MRKACIDTNVTLATTTLYAGDLGGGKTLFLFNMIDKSSSFKEINLHHNSSKTTFTHEEWAEAIAKCKEMANELKYEVTRIRGEELANPNK